ncbi:MAG: hypothetical protein KGS72_22555 [Cyanobacteria bacterium REEB67]|nr:hypothetical protein [Cyanobacteria bacterium REEB67]
MVSRIFQLVAFFSVLAAVVAPAYCANVSKDDLETKLPGNTAVGKMARSVVGVPYIESLRSAASNFRDYQCYCQLFTRKADKWKDFGGAMFFYKQKELVRAEIKSSDYRNGSIVVRQADGKIRGQGGGGLSLIKMTIQPDSRTIRLPTGFSLAQSDFVSLYDALKNQLNNGAEASVSAPVSLPAFNEPVLVLLLKNKKNDGGDSDPLHIIYLNPKTKIPLAWNTYKQGQSHAYVFFDDVNVNKGLTDDLFQL